MFADKEINALSQTFEALRGLDRRAIGRIVDWVSDKFGLCGQEAGLAQPGLGDEQAEAVSIEPAAAAEVPAEPVKKRRGRKPRAAAEAVDQDEPEIQGFFKYSSLKELITASKVKKSPQKILLAAAFLQENKGLKELTSNDISSDLKKIKIDIKNPSQVINNIMKKKSPWFELVGERGPSKQSRKKFRVTETGLDVAKSFVK